MRKRKRLNILAVTNSSVRDDVLVPAEMNFLVNAGKDQIRASWVV